MREKPVCTKCNFADKADSTRQEYIWVEAKKSGDGVKQGWMWHKECFDPAWEKWEKNETS